MYHGFTIDLLVELVRSGLATAQAERVVAGGRAMVRADHGRGAAGAGERLLTAGPPMTQFILSTIGGAVGAAVVWAVSSFVGGPVRRFFDLRGEVVRRLTEFANVRAKWKEFPYEPATDGPHDKEEQARLTSLPKNAANRGGLSQRTTVRFGDLLEPRPVKRRRVAGPDHARRR
jgi:hypothetical protein